MVFSQTPDSTVKPRSIFQNKVSLSVLINASNSVTVSASGSEQNYKADPSFGLGFEYYILKNEEGRSLGIGLEYQFKSTIPGVAGSYKNIPIFLFYDAALTSDNMEVIPKLSLRAGYNLFAPTETFISDSAKSSNGIYYALGLSSRVSKHFMIRLMYSANQGKIAFKENENLFTNQKVILGVFVLL